MIYTYGFPDSAIGGAMLHSRFDLAPHLRAVPHQPARRWPPLRLWVLGSFAVSVALPTVLAGLYLWFLAHPQYETRLDLTVQRAEVALPSALIPGLTSLAGQATPDTDLLETYLTSVAFAADLERMLAASTLYAKPSRDPWFAYDPATGAAGLRDYLPRMIRVSHDRQSRIVSVHVRAFSAQDSLQIAQAVEVLSQQVFTRLGHAAQAALVPAAEAEFARAKSDLSAARAALAQFRLQAQMVDPASDALGVMQVLTGLQEQLVSARIDHGLLTTTARTGDTRLRQATERITVIEGLIQSERLRLGSVQGDQPALATTLAEYERLSLDLVYAQQRFAATRAAYDAALARSDQNRLYTTAIGAPEPPDRADHPQSLRLVMTVLLCATLIWATAALTIAGLRDRV